MSQITPASATEIDAFLAQHPQWRHEERRLRRDFRFRDFVSAFGWMTQVAILAEKANHHPEWRNVWAFVHVTLTTHDAGDVVTSADISLAAQMESLFTLAGPQ